MVKYDARCTGRTRRMLEEAEVLSVTHPVIVVAADNNHVRNLRSRLPHDSRVDVLVDRSLAPGVQLRGSIVLFDHYTLSQRLSNILEEYHRYDEQPEPDPSHYCDDYYDGY